ncbi:MAG: hypothetical protein IJ731_09495 [Eubacterium sp.]|nr:hypothetical protein [Eubacterium sp.]
MKKTLAIILTLTLIFSFSACSKSSGTQTEKATVLSDVVVCTSYDYVYLL